jgi:hypothetical protein
MRLLFTSRKVVVLKNEYIHTQNYWGFGLYVSSGISEARKPNVSETGSISVLM